MRKINRRDWLRRGFGWSVLTPLGLALAGCAGQSPRPLPTPGVELALSYHEDQSFYNELSQALNAGRSVVISFDGTERLDEQAMLFKLLCDHERIASHEALWQSLDKFDTAEGRKQLAVVFAASQLDHQAVLKIDGHHTRENGEVVSPGVVLLVIVVTLLCSYTMLAAEQIALHGPIQAEFTLERSRVVLRMQPAPQ